MNVSKSISTNPIYHNMSDLRIDIYVIGDGD